MRTPIGTDNYVAAILHGDPVLLRQMYEQLMPLINKLIQQNGGSEEDTRDIFQDAVMIVYEKARQPGFQLTSQFSTYFYGICRNLWGNRMQKRSFSEVTIPEDAKYIEGELHDLDYSALEQRQLFDMAFAGLGEDCQRLLLLYFQKLPMDEIATEMGYSSEGYARRRKFMCKERLVELVKSYPEYLELCNAWLKENEPHGKR